MRWGKGIKPARTVGDFVNVRDLAPTCMEIASLKPHAQMTGKSLAADLAFAPTLDEMRYTMMRLQKEDGDPRALGKGDDFESLKYTGNRAKGYETWLKEQESGVLAELKKSPMKPGPNPARKRSSRAGSREMLNHAAPPCERNTAVPAVMANGRPACFGARRGSRDGLPAVTGGTPVIRFIQPFPGVRRRGAHPHSRTYSRVIPAGATISPAHFICRTPLKPFRTLAETRTPDGSRFTLHEHDGEYFLKLNGRQLMSTTSTTSELMLAELPCRRLRGRANAGVLIGGLGLGYSLQRVLEIVGPDATVHVAELLPEVVAWNREFLGNVNGKLLDDPRVKVIARDVFDVLLQAPKPSYDAILLDVDNGPTSFVQKKNSRIYGSRGFGLIARSLKPEGEVAFWAACPEPGFIENMKRNGFKASAYPAKAHEHAKRAAHMIYVAEVAPVVPEEDRVVVPKVHVKPWQNLPRRR